MLRVCTRSSHRSHRSRARVRARARVRTCVRVCVRVRRRKTTWVTTTTRKYTESSLSRRMDIGVQPVTGEVESAWVDAHGVGMLRSSRRTHTHTRGSHRSRSATHTHTKHTHTHTHTPTALHLFERETSEKGCLPKREMRTVRLYRESLDGGEVRGVGSIEELTRGRSYFPELLRVREERRDLVTEMASYYVLVGG